jgi:putative endopeptidase
MPNPLHRGLWSLVLAPLLVAGCMHAARPEANEPPERPPAPPPPPNIDVSIIDRSVDPCQDFYQFACNGWIQKTEIPADRPSWTRSFSEIDERNQALLRSYLEADAAGKGSPDDRYAQKLGDYWASCMDEERVERTALPELQAQLAKLSEVTDASSLSRTVARLHGAGTAALFDFGSGQDFKDATQVIGQMDQGGLGLPDRDYYLKDDAHSKEIRDFYLAHVAAMLRLLGESEAQAAADAQTVMRIEHALADASQTRVARRDPENVYHRIELAGLDRLAPHFPWGAYLGALGHPALTAMNVASPDFFVRVDQLVQTTPPEDLRTYLRWHLVHSVAATLPKRFVDEDFQFRSKAFTGAQRILPRWKRCIGAVNEGLGQALGQPFVRRTFGEQGKQANLARVTAIETAFRRELGRLTWMDPETRHAALAKLDLVANQIGYPDRWRAYDALVVDRKSYLANVMEASGFELQRQLDKIGKPVDRSDWEMHPQAVNAYYDPSLNEMVFPAGILQPPFYNRESEEEINYGGIGMVMGHELTHGFDDEGRKFDGYGNLHDWWTPKVSKEFDERSACVVRQFDGYVSVDDLHLNGKLTLGDNIADLGGITLAQQASVAAVVKDSAPHPGGFTPEQLFFLGYAQSWCQKVRPPFARMLVAVDPHSPARFRVNGPISNLPAFQQAFACKEGAPMVRADRCRVW